MGSYTEQFYDDNQDKIDSYERKIYKIREKNIKKRQKELDLLHKELLHQIREGYYFPARFINRENLEKQRRCWIRVVPLASKGKLENIEYLLDEMIWYRFFPHTTEIIYKIMELREEEQFEKLC